MAQSKTFFAKPYYLSVNNYKKVKNFKIGDQKILQLVYLLPLGKWQRRQLKRGSFSKFQN
jgi:hypothetical protein